MKKITLRRIGKVRNPIRRLKRDGWESIVSEIIIESEYEDGLEGIEEYSHLFILFWIDRLGQNLRGVKKIHPKSRKDLPLVGIFATRTQFRPNPIGLTMVKMLGRKKNIIKVKGLDCLNGTPVIDIKPISPRNEFPKKVRVPKWYFKLWKKADGDPKRKPKPS